jgi:hypothetical protein
MQPKLTRGRGPKVLKLSSNGSNVFPKVLKKVLKLSSEVSECKPLAGDGVACASGSSRDGAAAAAGGHAGKPACGVRGRAFHWFRFQQHNLSIFEWFQLTG